MQNLWSYLRNFLFSSYKRTIAFLAVLILAIAVPITLNLVSQKTEFFPRAEVGQPDRAIKHFEKICKDGTPQRPNNVLRAEWDAGIGDATDCLVEIIAGEQAQFLSNKCKDSWKDDITPFNEPIRDDGRYSIRIQRNGQIIGGPVQVSQNCSGSGGGGGGGGSNVCRSGKGSQVIGPKPAPVVPCRLVMPPPKGSTPIAEAKVIPQPEAVCPAGSGDELCIGDNPKFREITNCDKFTNRVNYFEKWWCSPIKFHTPSKARGSQEERDNHDKNQRKIVYACRGWTNNLRTNLTYMQDFQGRVRHLFSLSEDSKYNPKYTEEQRLEKWNRILMDEAWTGWTTLGWLDYDADLDYAARVGFNMSWNELKAKYQCGGSGGGGGGSFTLGGNFDVARCGPTQNKPEVLRGWACDPDNPNSDTRVKIYDGPKNSGGVFITEVVANIDRRSNPDPDYPAQWGRSDWQQGEVELATNTCKRSSSRINIGWRYAIPTDSFLRNGAPHTLFAYAVDVNGNTKDTPLTYFWYPSDNAPEPKYASSKPYVLTCPSAPSGSISVAPKVCDVPSGGSLCSVNVTALWKNSSSAEVCVSKNNGSETSFWGVPASGGTQEAPWIQPNVNFKFTLRAPAANCTGTILDSVDGITANTIPPTPTDVPPTSPPTVTQPPTITITQPPPPPGSTVLDLTVQIPGINSNTALGGNPSPKRPTRQVTVILLSPQTNQQVKEVTGSVTYDNTSSSYKGQINLGTDVPTGSYVVKINMDNTLRRQARLPDVYTITNGQATDVTKVALAPGDLKKNNLLDGDDYNLFIACFKNQSSCTREDRLNADFNDDGKVDVFDNGIIIRSFQKREGD